MESVRLLSNETPDREAWLRAWEATGREPFAHPDYVTIFSAPQEEAYAALVETRHGIALLPLVLRPLTTGSDLQGNVWRDATSPYGYGGPFGASAEALAEAWAVFGDWMSGHGIVSMFGRLSLGSPLPEPLTPGMVISSDSENVVVDLTRSADDQWMSYEHKVRKNVKKALRAGMTARVAHNFSNLAEFAALYAATMDRRGAADWYRFDEEFFASLTERLDGSYVAAEIRDVDNRLVSAELVLSSDTYLYSFLGGTLPDAFPHAPNDLLKHEVINFGRGSGQLGYVLGGGYAPNDGIFRYKRAFDPEGVVPFTRVEMVGDLSAYEELVALRHEELLEAGQNLQLEPGYFPAYRASFVNSDEVAAAAEA